MITLSILAIQAVFTLIALFFRLIILLCGAITAGVTKYNEQTEFTYTPQLQTNSNNDIMINEKEPGYYVYGKRVDEKKFRVIARYDEEKYARARLVIERNEHKDMLFISGRVD